MCVGITSHSARAKGATQEAHLFLIAAFCRRDQSLSHWRETRFLERAMGIEPTSEAWKVPANQTRSCRQWTTRASERIQPSQDGGCPQTRHSLSNPSEMRQFWLETSASAIHTFLGKLE